MEKKNTYRLLMDFSRGVRRFFLLAVAASGIGILANFLVPQVIRFTVDSVIGTEPMDLPGFLLNILDSLGGREILRSNLLFCGAGIVICAGLSGLFNYASRMNIAKGTEGFTKKLRDTLFFHIQSLPFSWHTANQTGDIIQRCTSDVETVRNAISTQLIEVIRTVILMIAAIALMFSMNVTLSLVALAFVPFIMLYSSIFYARIAKQFLKADESEGELMVVAQENLTGVRVVRAFGRERYERERFRQKNKVFADSWIDLGYTLGFFWGVGDFATCAQLLAVVVAGSILAANGKLTLGELLAFVSYTQTLAMPVRNLGRTLSELSKAGVSISRIRDILDSPPESEEPDAVKPDLHADIEFNNVSFSYGEHEILKNLSFTVKRGEIFGILGATGSGKSTMTYLLNRLYDLPDGCGSITIGGVDVKHIERKYLRKRVGLVLQEPFLFSKTVRENIELAVTAASLEKVREKTRVAAVDENILGFKDGYDTIVGERGVTLSGGQKQRITIARTLMTEAPIMVFDDSMSAVDMETDKRIRDALKENASGSTVILISHRINTLMQADRILVLENGRAAQLGTHAELAAQDGLYRRVYRMQSDAGLLTALEEPLNSPDNARGQSAPAHRRLEEGGTPRG